MNKSKKRHKHSAHKTEGENEKPERKPRSGFFAAKRGRMEIAIYVTGVIVAVLLIVICIIAVSSVDAKFTLTLWLGFAAVVFTLLGGCLFWQKQHWEMQAKASTVNSSDRRFSIAAEFVMGHGEKQLKSWHWVTYYGEKGWVACPVSVAINLRVTNLRNIPSFISAFKVEARNAQDDQWVRLDLMDVHSEGHSLYHTLATSGGLKESLKMNLGLTTFDYLITQPIPAHTPIRGWAFLAARAAVRVEQGDSIRVYLKDAEGAEMTETIILEQDRDVAVRGSDPFSYDGATLHDLSGYTLKFWDE